MAETTNRIKVQDLEVGAEVAIKGELGYSRWLTQLLDGEDLQKRINDDMNIRHSKYPNKDPRTEAQLVNAEIVCKDPQNPTLAETYAHDRIYPNKDGQQCFTIERKKGLPRFGIRQANGRIKQFKPEGKHFGEGNIVTCYYKVYQPENFANKGFGLQCVIFENEPIYYTSSGLPGGDWDLLPEDTSQQTQQAAPVQQAAPAGNDPWKQPAGQPVYAQQAVPQQPAALVQQPAAQTVPTQQAAPAQQAVPTGNGPWGNSPWEQPVAQAVPATPVTDGFQPAAGNPWA